MVKRYDRAQTPSQRLVAAGVLSRTQQEGLARLYQRRNPVARRRPSDTALDGLWRWADWPPTAASRPPDRPARPPVLTLVQ